MSEIGNHNSGTVDANKVGVQIFLALTAADYYIDFFPEHCARRPSLLVPPLRQLCAVSFDSSVVYHHLHDSHLASWTTNCYAELLLNTTPNDPIKDRQRF